MVSTKQETTLSFEKKDGPPTRTNGIRETWLGDLVSTEHWCTTSLCVNDSTTDLFCTKHDLPSSLGRLTMAVTSNSHSCIWLFRCGVENSRDTRGLSLKVFIKKYLAGANDEYITIPADHERLKLEMNYAGQAEFKFIHIFVMD
jgi:hypothetical protein